jgi:hypothetical protein
MAKKSSLRLAESGRARADWFSLAGLGSHRRRQQMGKVRRVARISDAGDSLQILWGAGAALDRRSRRAGEVRLVQHGSTATHLDAGGLAGTREDGDLHG